MPPAASTSNPSRFLAPFGLLPCLPQLQRPIHHDFLLLLDFCHASRSFNVQSVTLSCSFWTSTCLPQLQRPIRHAFLLLLDLCLLPRSFNVQSTTVSYSFWTSAMHPAALTSNPPRFLAPFGLLPCLPQLQRPIRHAFLLLLDFCHASRSFNIQSDTLSYSFWTSACFPAASTSNPSHFLAPFGLPHASRSFNIQSVTLSCSFWTSTCFPQLQHPIHHAFLLLLDFCLLPRSFNVQSVTLSYSFWTSAMPPTASTSNPSRIQATLASPQPQAPHNAKKQHQHISASIALYLLILF